MTVLHERFGTLAKVHHPTLVFTGESRHFISVGVQDPHGRDLILLNESTVFDNIRTENGGKFMLKATFCQNRFLSI